MNEIIANYLLSNCTPEEISKYQSLSEDFIGTHKDKINWKLICKHQKLSEEFMDAHIKFIDWEMVCQYQKLSEEFMDKYIDSLKYDLVVKHQSFSKDFLTRNIFKIAGNEKLAIDLFFENPTFKIEVKFFKRFFSKGYFQNKQNINKIILSTKYTDEEKEKFITILETYKDLV